MLLERTLGALDGGDVLSTLDDLAHAGLILGALDQVHQALVLGGEQEERVAEQRVGTGW